MFGPSPEHSESLPAANPVRSNQSHGFTLIELMVVIVILGIMAGMILPEMMGTFSDSKIRAAARKIIYTSGLAQSQAVSSRTPHRLNLDDANHQFAVTRKMMDPQRGEIWVPVTEFSGMTGSWADEVSVTLRDPAPDQESGVEQNTNPAQPTPMDSFLIQPPTDVSMLASTNSTTGTFIEFQPEGSVTLKEIVLQSESGLGLLIEILPATGRMSVGPLDKD